MPHPQASSFPLAPAESSPSTDLGAPLRWTLRAVLALAVVFIVSVLVWQGVTAHGTPDPTATGTAPAAAVFSIGSLVFREGLECILVLAAIMAGMNGTQRAYRRPVAWGAGVAFLASIVTWFVAVGILSNLMESVPALHLQAATGLLAVVVLLVIMNWFFHKVYWGGWIGFHNRRRKALMAEGGVESRAGLLWGLGLLGFTSLYREGFEIVLFLQSYRLKLGGEVVLWGTLIGLLLSGSMAVLTFVAHRKLPYRKMLVFTGVLLGAVLLVMVGEQAQEMQLAGWLPTTKIAFLEGLIPDWAGIWFALFPTVETLVAQALAALLVVGSYFAARRQKSVGGEAITAPATA